MAGGCGEREGFELLGGEVEADESVGAEVGEPDEVELVDVDGVGAGSDAGEGPFTPVLGAWIEAGELAGIPLADPDAAGGV